MPEAARSAALPLDMQALLSAKQEGYAAPGSMSQYRPSTRDSISDFLRWVGGIVNANPQSVDSLIGGMDYVPLLGEAVGGGEAGEEIGKGNYLSGGAQLAASLIPGGGKAVKALRKGDDLADLFKVVPDDPAQLTAPGKDPEWFHRIGGKAKLQRPLSEMTSTTVPTGPMTPSRQISPEELQGGILMPLYGDKTRAGETLTHVNETALPRPQPLQGGAGFMRENPGQIWASDKSPMSSMSNRVQKIAEESGKPVYGVHVAMGPASGDFARMTTRPLLDMAKEAPIKRADLKLFDEEMGNATGGNWPGLKKAGDLWLAEAPGSDRATMAKVMAQANYQKAGFPDVGSLRKAVTDPLLLNRPILTSGRTVGRFDPTGKLSPSGHDTYRTQIAGDYVGDLGLLPPEALFPDFMKTQQSMTEPQIGKSFQTKLITQEADQQWLDRIMAILGGQAK